MHKQLQDPALALAHAAELHLLLDVRTSRMFKSRSSSTKLTRQPCLATWGCTLSPFARTWFSRTPLCMRGSTLGPTGRRRSVPNTLRPSSASSRYALGGWVGAAMVIGTAPHYTGHPAPPNQPPPPNLCQDRPVRPPPQGATHMHCQHFTPTTSGCNNARRTHEDHATSCVPPAIPGAPPPPHTQLHPPTDTRRSSPIET